MELEALNATDGEGGEGQSKRLGGGVHEVEGGSEVDRAACLALRPRCPVPSLCFGLMAGRSSRDGCGRSGVPDCTWSYTQASLHAPQVCTINNCILQMHPDETVDTRHSQLGE